ncbi:MAG: ribosome maturation factor RimM [Lachnospiraceae bacterium]|nr:ribosome maturation factor RimM [Lachnospiraceae bacterium]
MDKYLRVGTVIKPHGVKGEIKVFPTTDEPHRFEEIEEVILEEKNGYSALRIDGVKYLKGQVVLKLDTVDSVEDAEKLRGKDLLMPRELSGELGENENFIGDLIGLAAFDEAGERIGTLDAVIQTGANDVYSVIRPDGSELLIPAIRDCIIDVSPEEGTITVRLLPGL